MSSNSRNVKLPFLTTRCQSWGIDLPVHLPLYLPIWPLTVEMWICHSKPLDGSTGGLHLPVDLSLHLPIWALTVEMWNYHSWPLDASTWGGVDLPLHLPIWARTVEMWNCHSWPLDGSTGGRSASTSSTSSANTSSISRNVKSPFLTTRWQYQGVDLPVHLPLHLTIWALTVEMWNHHSWPLDASTGG